MDADSPPLTPGTVLPDGSGVPTYKIIEHIANGGMAGVYHVEIVDRTDGPFAMKINFQARRAPMFYREAQWLSIQKPGLVPCYWADHTVIDETPTSVYIMPYLHDGSLVSRLHRKSYNHADAVSWIYSISETLESVGCVHRDLKPENVLMISNQPLVADFGLAIHADMKVRAEWGEVPEYVVGTPPYMSPEQHLTKCLPELDCRSDIYTLTLMLHELWFGELPFPSDISSEEMQSLKISGALKPIASTKIVSADELLIKGLTSLRARRYQTHAEFQAALRRVHVDVIANPVPR